MTLCEELGLVDVPGILWTDYVTGRLIEEGIIDSIDDLECREIRNETGFALIC